MKRYRKEHRLAKKKGLFELLHTKVNCREVETSIQFTFLMSILKRL